MVYTVSEKPSSQQASSSNTSEPISTLQLPEAITETIAEITLTERALLSYKTFLTVLIRNHGLAIKGIKFHPDYPFLSLFHIHELFRLPKEALCFFWYLFESYTIGISFNSVRLQSYILQCQFESAPPHSRNLFSLLQWFLPPHQWMKMLSSYNKTYVVIMFRRPCSFFPPSMVRINQSIVYHSPTALIHGDYHVNPSSSTARLFYSENWMKVRHALAEANGINPKTIPIHIMQDMCAWSDDHIVSSKWIEALDEWKSTHLSVHEDTSDDAEINDDEDEDTQHYDPYEDDPSHPDSRWK